MYDITRRGSFEGVEGWIRDLRQRAGQSVDVVLIGNKCDMESKRVRDTMTQQAPRCHVASET